MDDQIAIAIIVGLIILMFVMMRTEGFGAWRRDTFIAQYGVTSG